MLVGGGGGVSVGGTGGVGVGVSSTTIVMVGGGQLQLDWLGHSGFLQTPLTQSNPAGHGLLALHASLHSGGGGGGVLVGGGGGVLVGGGQLQLG